MSSTSYSLHKIIYEGNYAIRLYLISNGGCWWGVHPADLLFPKDEDYLEEGFADREGDGWHEGIEALVRRAEAERQ